MLGATSSSMFSTGGCDYDAFVMAPCHQRGGQRLQENGSDELFIEMEYCADDGLQ